MNEKTKKFDAVDLMDWLKRDWYVVLVLVFALFACIYTINNTGKYVNACNEHWTQQVQPILDRCYVSESVTPILVGFNMSGVGLNGT